MAADKGVDACDAEMYASELCILHDSSAICYRDAWDIIHSEEYMLAVQEYNMYKSFGLPRGGGWKDQSVVWVGYVSAVERAVRVIEQDALKRAKP